MSLTAANSVFTLAISGLFSIPQTLQGYSADDILGMEELDAGQVIMGVDGNTVAGMVQVPTKQTVYLQADSPSNLIFEAWRTAELGAKQKYSAIGVIQYPSVNRLYALTTGWLTKYPQLADAKKSLQPRRYEITWQTVLVTPTSFSIPH
jgi:hypothetical protein